MKLIFLRHGETDWNARLLIQGRTDIPLNDTGRAQAAAICVPHTDAIYCSPMQRAKETAEIVNQNFNLPMQTDERLIERDYGSFEGTANAGRWLTEDELARHNAEPLAQLHARVSSFLRDIAEKHKNQTVIVVAHGGIGRMVQACFCAGKARRLGHCEPVCFEGPQTQWVVDRIVDDMAVLEREDESFEHVSAAELPKGVREGSVLVRYMDTWQLDQWAEHERRAKLKKLQDGLFGT